PGRRAARVAPDHRVVANRATADTSTKTGSSADAAPLPPVYPGTWLLGNVREFWRDPGGALAAAYARCGPVFRLRGAWRWYTFIAGAEAAEFLRQGLDKMYLSRGRVFAAVHGQFGRTDFVFAESGAGHARLRRLLAIAFSREVASPFVP